MRQRPAPTGSRSRCCSALSAHSNAEYYQVRFFADTDWVELPTDEIDLVLDGSGATASNLPDYGVYYFAVRAGNAAGVSEWSDYLTLPNPEQ